MKANELIVLLNLLQQTEQMWWINRREMLRRLRLHSNYVAGVASSRNMQLHFLNTSVVWIIGLRMTSCRLRFYHFNYSFINQPEPDKTVPCVQPRPTHAPRPDPVLTASNTLCCPWCLLLLYRTGGTTPPDVGVYEYEIERRAIRCGTGAACRFISHIGYIARGIVMHWTASLFYRFTPSSCQPSQPSVPNALKCAVNGSWM